MARFRSSADQSPPNIYTGLALVSVLAMAIAVMTLLLNRGSLTSADNQPQARQTGGR